MSASEEITPVSKNNHKDYSFRVVTSHESSFEFFKSTSFCPIYLSEFNSIACNYPIVFMTNSKNEFICASLFSLLKDRNPFINQNYHWTLQYFLI